MNLDFCSKKSEEKNKKKAPQMLVFSRLITYNMKETVSGTKALKIMDQENNFVTVIKSLVWVVWDSPIFQTDAI